MADARPTPAELADAAHRLADALDEVHAALTKCGEILRERQPAGSYSTYPLFWDGDTIKSKLQVAREALWAAAKPVAEQGFNEGRAAALNDGLKSP
jgi:phytoene dehydrogenase-like protein